MSLKTKTIRGVFWVSLSNILLKVLNFIISIILARLLEPSDFGLVAMGLIIVNFFEIFRDLGIGASLIYRKDNMDKAANTAFFIFPIVAIAFYAVSYLIAPLASDFFREENVEILIKVLSLTFVIWSFGNLPRTLLTKDLEFKKLVIPQILPKLGYGTVAIGMAFYSFGVWSLVGGRLVLEVLSVITIWHAIDWRPSYKFNKKAALELISYGKHVMSANVIVFFISVIDVMFIGRLLGSESLGYYSIAFGIAGLLTAQVSDLMGQVMFPAYSKIQGDKNALKKAYLKTLKYLSIIAIPATFGIAVIAWDFVKVVYGDKWLPAVAALQVLCFYGLNRALLGTTEQLYLAAGKPEIRTKLNLLQLILMSILMYPLTIHYGILGTGIAATLPSALIVFLTFREAGKIIEESFAYIAGSFAPGITGSLIMVLVIYAWQYASASFSPALRLGVSIVLGSLVYLAFLWMTRKELFYEIKELVAKG
jgi:O-antigen/teichoic acid export membrane protein